MKVVLSDIVEKAKGTAQERRAFVEGAGYVIERIQEYAVELFLRGDHYSEIPAERLRDLSNNLYLELAKVVTMAQKLEEQDRQDKETERRLMTAHPPENPPCVLCGTRSPNPECPYHKFAPTIVAVPPKAKRCESMSGEACCTLEQGHAGQHSAPHMGLSW